MQDIERIRAFNRTVTRRLGVLNERYLGRNRPLVESRLLYEIGTRGASVRELRTRLGLDSGFSSRLLRALERKKLLKTERAGSDGRVRVARLTRSGLAELGRLNSRADDLARSMLAPLSAEQARRLVAAMSEVDRLVRASSIEFAPEDARSADAERCLQRYYAELAARFPGGFALHADDAPDMDEVAPPGGCMLMARLFGEPVGCGMIRTLAPGVGELKRMWVSPEVRGLGVGRRLLAELEAAALERKLRTVRLDTNGTLAEALSLYRASGYREIPRYNDNPYAQHWFEKVLS
ncbi:MAG TPA: bifunctional helix-turn-helix transcriptional regulator/GNAT family N-acetyltransferase [Steroidobacteraceae bacterium]|nr:bifunctional helix-turn-helix transcriptional regulator/GNAT family N-acetyltransferase [Steroidobacteraceae bacterium]